MAARLQALHPDGPQVSLGLPGGLPYHIPTPPSSDPEEEKTWDRRIRTAVTKFPPGSAPGPSGLRPSHLKECLRKAGSASCLMAGMAPFVRAAVAGLLPEALQPLLCGSSLIPLNKKDGGVRPIAVGDTLRRLIGKVTLSLEDVREQVQALKPRQCGVGVPNACEMVGMGLQRLADQHPEGDWVAVQVDVSNAFNTVHRTAMLQQCHQKTPAAYNWLAWSYRAPVSLYCQGTEIAQSKTGVHQGDAMGPLGFALGLDAALSTPECERAATNLRWLTWYLDDGTIVGKPEDVSAYLKALFPALLSVGLAVNFRKCLVWGPGGQQEGQAPSAAMGALPPDSPLRLLPIIPFGPSTGITSLGVPVDVPGPRHSMGRAKWKAAVTQSLELLERLRMLPDGQTRHCLLRFCLDACRVTHLMRSAPWEAGEQEAEALSDALRVAVADLVGCGVGGLAWDQAVLPISAGGLGIRDPLTSWSEARLAALITFHRHATASVGVPEETRLHPAGDRGRTLLALAAILGPYHDPLSRWVSDPSSIAAADNTHASQHWWAEQCVKARKLRLHELGTARDQVRFTSQAGALATGWLQVLPSPSLGTVIPDTTFRSLCRWWLGLPLLPEGVTLPPCPLCGQALDPFGDHFVVCKLNGPTRRHNALRDEWGRVLTQASIPWRKEVPTTGGDRPDDILLLNFSKGKHCSLDITVVSPTALGEYPLSALKAKGRLAAAERDKTNKEAASCARMGWSHHPAAYSTWGAQGPGASAFMAEILRQATADLEGWPKIRRIMEIRQGLSVTLAKQLGLQLALRCQVLESLEA